ncbi:protein-glutamate methylesterase/protein-glutamine glutaminase [Salipaludibacillus aurantiacus]|uniref:Protein-glutamate methylesterase/protein-glutamine glutaminase n=1 Tax=Salipaludibacillus aurantiacus TaxID=1601833 RepID=A0A1H9QJ23_9BACI|nr:chemotaxis response regulator protein-glutamate methylesterase [Salipaludibacillus aurantiacus]SER60195.1 two-component system, chemotaxis family, response regulator CheB [Salipaludibacillus aurantiacus]
MTSVLVVDDSAFMRKMISEMLDNQPDIYVIDKARNGKDAVEKVKQLNPDVITMDVEMPVMSGIEALKEIMAENPKPVIMISSVTKEGADTTIKAMEYGAFDFISKPSGSISLDIHKVEKELIDKVRLASSVKVTKLTHSPAGKTAPDHLDPSIKTPKEGLKSGVSAMVVIGTSTGGPKALQKVLPQLPETFPHPVLVVQHMPEGFTKSLSERLDALSKIKVKEAENGEIIKKGVAYIAPGGYHLKVRRIGTSVAIHLDQSTSVNGHRPSVDVMFTSLSAVKLDKVIAVLMTGMGQDGKNGLLHLKKSVKTAAIAESESTAVVFGMPKAAIETNLVDEVKDIDAIAASLLKHS